MVACTGVLVHNRQKQMTTKLTQTSLISQKTYLWCKCYFYVSEKFPVPHSRTGRLRRWNRWSLQCSNPWSNASPSCRTRCLGRRRKPRGKIGPCLRRFWMPPLAFQQLHRLVQGQNSGHATTSTDTQEFPTMINIITLSFDNLSIEDQTHSYCCESCHKHAAPCHQVNLKFRISAIVFQSHRGFGCMHGNPPNAIGDFFFLFPSLSLSLWGVVPLSLQSFRDWTKVMNLTPWRFSNNKFLCMIIVIKGQLHYIVYLVWLTIWSYSMLFAFIINAFSYQVTMFNEVQAANLITVDWKRDT